jgi:hypothetical protein
MCAVHIHNQSTIFPVITSFTLHLRRDVHDGDFFILLIRMYLFKVIDNVSQVQLSFKSMKYST